MKSGKNPEGYSDPTASTAVGHVFQEQQLQRLHDTVHLIRAVAELGGYEVVGRITLKDKETGKVYR